MGKGKRLLFRLRYQFQGAHLPKWISYPEGAYLPHTKEEKFDFVIHPAAVSHRNSTNNSILTIGSTNLDPDSRYEIQVPRLQFHVVPFCFLYVRLATPRIRQEDDSIAAMGHWLKKMLNGVVLVGD